MTVTYNIGSLAACVQLTAVAGWHGNIIRAGLQWQLLARSALTANQPTRYVSESSPARFDLPEGTYNLQVFYQNNTHDFGEYTFKKNTLTDLMFVLHDANRFDSEEGYYADYDPLQEYARRVEQRGEQAKYGNATTPLTDPYRPEAGEKSGYIAHPLLQNAQFDGIEPKVNPQPSENHDAIAKELELQHQSRPRPDATPKPSR